jgi:geranylgeranyl diphosphate synthase, type I
LEAPPSLNRHRRAVDEYLRSLVARQEPPELYRMLRYHMGWEDAQGNPSDQTGKALRPSFCLLACETVGGDWRQALPAAAALELVHNFSLIHDDIQDRDQERHHRPTVWVLWGEAQAINAGDALLALARLAMLSVPEGVKPQAVLEGLRLLDERTLEMVEGQVMDLSFEDRLDVQMADYLGMIERKTGALFDAAFALGALMAGAEHAAVQAMGRCGRLLGVAFQARDDMLGIWGAVERTGKPTGADIRRRKKSLPVVYALHNARGETLDRLQRVLSHPTEPGEQEVSQVIADLEALSAREYCHQMAAEGKEAALSQLDRARVNPEAAQELRDAALFLLERDY